MPLALTPVDVSVVGAGRLGTAFARALLSAGVEVHGPFGRGEPVETAHVVLLCVGDAHIRSAARAHAGIGRFLGHTSGATPVADSGVDFGLHPLGTFAGGEGIEHFRGIGCGVAGRTPDAEGVARGLAEAVGANAFTIADDARALYHAAASMASNYLVTLQAAAERLAAAAGIPADDTRWLFAPLVRGTVENWAGRGAEAALTGPIARGDEQTVARQRAAVVEHAPELVDLFDVLAAHTRALAARGRMES